MSSHTIFWHHTFLPCYPFWIEPRKTCCLFWTAPLSFSLCFPISTLGERWELAARKTYQASYSDSKINAFFCWSARQLVFGQIVCEIVCLKRRSGIYQKMLENILLNYCSPLLKTQERSQLFEGNRGFCSIICWMGHTIRGNYSRGVTNSISKFYVGLMLLLCLTIVFSEVYV